MNFINSLDFSFLCVLQVGYFRALHGIASVINLERLSKDLDKECRAALKVTLVPLFYFFFRSSLAILLLLFSSYPSLAILLLSFFCYSPFILLLSYSILSHLFEYTSLPYVSTLFGKPFLFPLPNIFLHMNFSISKLFLLI